MQTRFNLDALRAFAVLVVFLDHLALASGVQAFHGVSLGWLGVFGVYLFFVHTSLVLMWSLERRPNTADFYIRRIFRIYPLAVLTLLLCANRHVRQAPMFTEGKLTVPTFLANLFLVQNLWIHPNIIGVYWSLPLEVDMYLLLPVLYSFAQFERRRWALILLWTAACALDIATYGRHAGNGSFMVVPHFIPGVIAYLGYQRVKPALPAWSLVPLLGLLLIFFLRSPGPIRGWFVCLVLGLALPYVRDMVGTTVKAVGHTMATYSYGIYLLHPLCLWFGFHVLRSSPFWVQLGATLALLASLCKLSYRYIEVPGILLGSRIADVLEHRRSRKMRATDLSLEMAP